MAVFIFARASRVLQGRSSKSREDIEKPDGSYFVLYWGQFEAFINAKFVEMEGDVFEVGLMSKAQLVISPKHEYYNEIDRYYVLRCKLAHGEAPMPNALNLSSIFDKLDDIIQKIETGPLPIGDVFLDFALE